jgi:hypothetical protein
VVFGARSVQMILRKSRAIAKQRGTSSGESRWRPGPCAATTWRRAYCENYKAEKKNKLRTGETKVLCRFSATDPLNRSPSHLVSTNVA